jgi:hypothetical protein
MGFPSPRDFPWFFHGSFPAVFHPPKPDFRDLNEEAKELKSFCSKMVCWGLNLWDWERDEKLPIHGIWDIYMGYEWQILVGYFYTVWCFGTWLL